MARRERRTVPLRSKVGILETFAEQEPYLIEAEWRGRDWAHSQARNRRPLSDVAILELHEAMFAPLLDWAGRTRTEDVGPGGKVDVPYGRVREELRKLGDDFATWLMAAGQDPTLEQLGHLVADAHHRFQWVHPFADTNGRTGRALDHFILWSCFGLANSSMETSPVLVYFPDDAQENDYYEGLIEADLHRPDRLRAYYVGRLEKALIPVFTVHRWDGVNATPCVAIHESADAAVRDAQIRSVSDPEHAYCVLGEGGRVVARALGGKLVDDDGSPAST